jgi:hypothetical protein
MGFRPSHRNPDDIQPETCDLCGNLVGHQHLLESPVQGLRGFRICDLHQFERRARMTPSYMDIRALSRLPSAPYAGQRLEPHGGALWYQDVGVVLREDGSYLLRQDGSFFFREGA